MLDINDFIDEERIITQSTTETSSKVMHVILCFDEDYAMPAGINMVSILDNNKNSQFHFHLFVTHISDSSIDKFKQIDSVNSSITLYKVNQYFQISKKNTSSFPISACIRLIAPLFLHELPYLLYLDSDMLCVGNLSKIQEIDISNVITAVVPDVDKMQQARCKQFGLQQGEYFNSGMMYINTQLWSQFSITEKALELLNSSVHYKFPDQDVLNSVINQNKLLLDKRFNCITELSVGGNEDQRWLANSVILHYTTGHKPWYRLFLTPTYKKYWQLSPWKDQKLLLVNENAPSTTRRYAKLLASQHRYVKALRFYLLYLKHKLCTR